MRASFILLILASLLAGTACTVNATENAPRSLTFGTLQVDWSIGGVLDPNLCYQSGAATMAIEVYDARDELVAAARLGHHEAVAGQQAVDQGARLVAARGYELWLWSIDSHDWQMVGDAQRVAMNVIRLLGNMAGGTVLMHEADVSGTVAIDLVVASSSIRDAVRLALRRLFAMEEKDTRTGRRVVLSSYYDCDVRVSLARRPFQTDNTPSEIQAGRYGLTCLLDIDVPAVRLVASPGVFETNPAPAIE